MGVGARCAASAASDGDAAPGTPFSPPKVTFSDVRGAMDMLLGCAAALPGAGAGMGALTGVGGSRHSHAAVRVSVGVGASLET